MELLGRSPENGPVSHLPSPAVSSDWPERHDVGHALVAPGDDAHVRDANLWVHAEGSIAAVSAPSGATTRRGKPKAAVVVACPTPTSSSGPSSPTSRQLRSGDFACGSAPASVDSSSDDSSQLSVSSFLPTLNKGPSSCASAVSTLASTATTTATTSLTGSSAASVVSSTTSGSSAGHLDRKAKQHGRDKRPAPPGSSTKSASAAAAVAAASAAGCDEDGPFVPREFHPDDVQLARMLSAVSQAVHASPTHVLQTLLNFAPEDQQDLVSALVESGCSYVYLLACHLHNLRTMAEEALDDSAIPAAAEDSKEGKAGRQGATPAAAATNAAATATETDADDDSRVGLRSSVLSQYRRVLSRLANTALGLLQNGGLPPHALMQQQPPPPPPPPRNAGGVGSGGVGGARVLGSQTLRNRQQQSPQLQLQQNVQAHLLAQAHAFPGTMPLPVPYLQATGARTSDGSAASLASLLPTGPGSPPGGGVLPLGAAAATAAGGGSSPSMDQVLRAIVQHLGPETAADVAEALSRNGLSLPRDAPASPAAAAGAGGGTAAASAGSGDGALGRGRTGPSSGAPGARGGNGNGTGSAFRSRTAMGMAPMPAVHLPQQQQQLRGSQRHASALMSRAHSDTLVLPPHHAAQHQANLLELLAVAHGHAPGLGLPLGPALQPGLAHHEAFAMAAASNLLHPAFGGDPAAAAAAAAAAGGGAAFDPYGHMAGGWAPASPMALHHAAMFGGSAAAAASLQALLQQQQASAAAAAHMGRPAHMGHAGSAAHVLHGALLPSVSGAASPLMDTAAASGLGVAPLGAAMGVPFADPSPSPYIGWGL